MPALNHPRPHTETLANGLRVTLRHAPDSEALRGGVKGRSGQSRCAAGVARPGAFS